MSGVNGAPSWVLFAYRLPREPSTPRINLWRKLRRLGVVQLLDGLVGLPQTDRSREQLEWLADEVLEAGGEATLWLAAPAAAAQRRELVDRMTLAVCDEYGAVADDARAALTEDATAQRRTLVRLRRELHRIAERDYFPPPEREQARAAIEALAATLEVTL